MNAETPTTLEMSAEGAGHALFRLRPQLERALELGNFTQSFSDVLHAVSESRAQVWYTDDSILITEIVTSAGGPLVNMWLAGGELEGCLYLSECAIEAAKDLGCTTAIMMGRRGWEKVTRERGWKPTATVFSRELT